MDTEVPAGNNAYRWPTDVISSLDLTRNEIGVIGWMGYDLAGKQIQLFLPVNVARRTPPPKRTSYELIIMAGVELKEMYLSLAQISAPSGLTYLYQGKPLGYHYYPPDRPIKIELANPPSPGVYFLNIGASLRRGGSAAEAIFFYYPGE
jgi:hypothetical protein